MANPRTYYLNDAAFDLNAGWGIMSVHLSTSSREYIVLFGGAGKSQGRILGPGQYVVGH